MWIFKTKKQIRAEIEAEIEAEKELKKNEASNGKQCTIAQTPRAMIDAGKKIVEEEKEGMHFEDEREAKLSREPWVIIKGMVNDPVKGIKIELDWNDAFIQYLKENGYTGTDENQLIQQYVIHVMQDVDQKMKEEQDMQSRFE